MDGLILVGIALYFILSNSSTKRAYVVNSDIEERDNPNFYRDENAFSKLYNAIMEGDKR